MLADPDFVERKVTATRPVNSTAQVTGTLADGFTVTTVRDLSTADLPAAAQRLVGPTVRIQLVETWSSAAADGSRSGSVTVEVVGKPARASGTASLTQSGSTTTLIYQGSVEAKVPLIGPRLEEQAASQVQAVLAAEHSVGLAWLAER